MCLVVVIMNNQITNVSFPHSLTLRLLCQFGPNQFVVKSISERLFSLFKMDGKTGTKWCGWGEGFWLFAAITYEWYEGVMTARQSVTTAAPHICVMWSCVRGAATPLHPSLCCRNMLPAAKLSRERVITAFFLLPLNNVTLIFGLRVKHLWRTPTENPSTDTQHTRRAVAHCGNSQFETRVGLRALCLCDALCKGFLRMSIPTHSKNKKITVIAVFSRKLDVFCTSDDF